MGIGLQTLTKVAVLTACSTLLATGLLAKQIVTLETFEEIFGQYTKIEGLSGDGSTIIGRTQNWQNYECFGWNKGDLYEFGLYHEVNLKGVAYDGWPVLGSADPGIYGKPRLAAYWNWDSQQAKVVLHNLPQPTKADSTEEAGLSDAFFISRDETVIVGDSELEDSTHVLCIWTNGQLESIENPPFTSAVYALDASEDCSIVVGRAYEIERGGYSAYIYKNGTFSLLALPPELGPDIESAAISVSGDGSLVLGRAWVSQQYRYILWENEVPRLMDIHHPTGDYAVSDMSADGKVLVGHIVVEGMEVPCMWSYNDGLNETNIFQLLEAEGLFPEGYDSGDAEFISPDGSTIVGTLAASEDPLPRNVVFRLKFLNTYGPYPITDGYCDTTPWLNWLWVANDPWVWCVDMNHWLYCPGDNVTESGAWVYIPK